MAFTFEDDIFIVDCWVDTIEKKKVLKDLESEKNIIEESINLYSLFRNMR